MNIVIGMRSTSQPSPGLSETNATDAGKSAGGIGHPGQSRDEDYAHMGWAFDGEKGKPDYGVMNAAKEQLPPELRGLADQYTKEVADGEFGHKDAKGELQGARGTYKKIVTAVTRYLGSTDSLMQLVLEHASRLADRGLRLQLNDADLTNKERERLLMEGENLGAMIPSGKNSDDEIDLPPDFDHEKYIKILEGNTAGGNVAEIPEWLKNGDTKVTVGTLQTLSKTMTSRAATMETDLDRTMQNIKEANDSKASMRKMLSSIASNANDTTTHIINQF